MLGLAGELCTERYEQHKNPCRHCPIREECHGGPMVLTWQTLEEWQDKCNVAASKYYGGSQ